MTDNDVAKLIHSLELTCQLVNTQQAEINCFKNELHRKVEYVHEQRKVIDEKKAEIERLTEEINALNGNTEKYIAECEKRSREIAEDYRKEIKAEIIKDFADALKSKSELVAPSVYAVPYRAVSVDDIDKFVKIAGGEENA